MPRAWPDLDLPKPSTAAETMPPAIKQQLVKDMMLQHDTTCKVLDRLRINACKEHHSSSAVLARVRRENTQCSICVHTFNLTQSLRTYIQGQHMDASHLKCSRCDYSAGDTYSLRLHSRMYDPEGKTFKCDWVVCDQAFNTKGHHNEHKKSHIQGRSPPCPHCGKDFAGKYSLKSHLLSCPSTPGGVPEKQFQCEICGKMYYQQSELTRHQKSKGHSAAYVYCYVHSIILCCDASSSMHVTLRSIHSALRSIHAFHHRNTFYISMQSQSYHTSCVMSSAE